MTAVVVVGSGAAGLAAALGAAATGADVTVVERDDTVGGTTALSGGVVWLPANDAMMAAGLVDSPTEAWRYLGGLATGEVDADLMVAFASDAIACPLAFSFGHFRPSAFFVSGSWQKHRW